jgi:GntR family transcriptional regulator/MocR family aminotransferase
MYIPALSNDSGLALYMQLYNSLRRDILSNRLSSGTRLPSKRLLASGLGISINTVDTAYQQLVSEGYLEARAKSGYFVCDLGINIHLGINIQKSNSTFLTKPDPLNHNFSFDSAPAAASDSAPDSAPAAAPASVNKASYIDFSPNGVDLEALPLAKFRKTIRDVFEDEGTRAFSNCDPQGAIELRFALCQYLRESRGLNCHPDQIIIGAGTDYMLQLLVQILRSAHKMDAVAMENPVYNKAYQIFTGLQVPVELIPLDKSGVHMDSLRRSRSNLVYTTPSHQFPLGIIMPVSRRTELLAWAAEAGNRYIIEDDYDSEFRYAGRPIPAISGLDPESRVIYSGTFSKSIAPSVRISYLVVPPDLLQDFHSNLSYYNTTITHLDQLVLARFIKSGDFERHINRMRTLYRRKRDLFLKTLSPYKSKLQISGTDAGLHLLCQVKNGMSEKELIESAKNAAAKVYGISSYYMFDKTIEAVFPSAVPKSTVLLGYANLSDAQIEKGAAALAAAWQL